MTNIEEHWRRRSIDVQNLNQALQRVNAWLISKHESAEEWHVPALDLLAGQATLDLYTSDAAMSDIMTLMTAASTQTDDELQRDYAASFTQAAHLCRLFYWMGREHEKHGITLDECTGEDGLHIRVGDDDD